MIYREGDDRYELLQDDEFLQDDRYGDYPGPDLSGDPMLSDDKKPKKKKESRKEKKARLEQERLEAEREAIRAELLAEMKAGGSGAAGSTSLPEDGENDGNGDTGKRSRFGEYLMSVLSGNILSRSEVRKIYPYLLFIAFLAFLYIGNVFRMQRLHRKHDRLTVEVRELRAKSMTIAAVKMNATRQSNIIKEIGRRGLPLKESLTPNKVIEK